jgi:hypothetical protein
LWKCQHSWSRGGLSLALQQSASWSPENWMWQFLHVPPRAGFPVLGSLMSPPGTYAKSSQAYIKEGISSLRWLTFWGPEPWLKLILYFPQHLIHRKTERKEQLNYHQQVLARMWGKRNPLTLLVGM